MQSQYSAYMRAAGMRPPTIKLKLYYLNRAEHALGSLADVSAVDLLGWLSEQEWAPETRKSARAALRGFYRWAVENEHLTTDPTLRLPAVRVPLGVPRPAPCLVLRTALLGASDRDRLLLELAGYAGLRRSEVASLPWSAMEWNGLRVKGKGGRTRTVPMADALRDDLAAECARREAGRCGTGWRYQVDPASPYVFPGLHGGHMSPETVGSTLADLLGGGWTGHTLRHRFATMAYAVDRDLLTVQQLLGHSKPETTARYTAVPHGAAVAAVAGVAA